MDQIIAIAAAFISLIALIVAIWSGVMSRRHNRLSLKPLLIIRYHLGGSRGYFGLSINNEGPGPALIKKVVLKLDDMLLIEESEDRKWEKAISALDLNNLKPVYNTIEHGVIRSGDNVKLLSVDTSEESRDKMKSALGHLNVYVSYESVYEEKYSTQYNISTE